MVKNYIVASVLLGSMLAGHAHAVTAPHATLRKLQQDNYGDWYDPYGVDTDDGSRPATLRGKTTFHLKQSLQKESSSF